MHFRLKADSRSLSSLYRFDGGKDPGALLRKYAADKSSDEWGPGSFPLDFQEDQALEIQDFDLAHQEDLVEPPVMVEEVGKTGAVVIG